MTSEIWGSRRNNWNSNDPQWKWGQEIVELLLDRRIRVCNSDTHNYESRTHGSTSSISVTANSEEFIIKKLHETLDAQGIILHFSYSDDIHLHIQGILRHE